MQLLVLAIMSHLFGTELVSWDKGVAVYCAEE
jgi:hypothetical protein